MKAVLRILIAGAALGLAGCANLPGANMGDTFRVEGFMNKSLPGGSYVAEQAVAYQARAAHEANVDGNWYDATAFYRKGATAAGGVEVAPWDPAIFGLTGAPVTAYQQMLPVLNANKDIRQEACARMVAFYDHWLEELREENHSITPASTMQSEYAKAYVECSGGFVPAAESESWIIYFGFDRSDLTAQGRAVVDEVVAAVQSYSALSIVGHTDTVGSKAYNQRLSERRARNVASAIAAGGVDRGMMTISGRSELDPAVPTGDGVREAQNRRVEITASE